MMKYILLVLLLIAVNLSVKAQSDSTYKKLLTQMLNSSQTVESTKSRLQKMLDQMKNRPGNTLSPQLWAELEKQLYEFYDKEYPMKLYPIYRKYLSEDDLVNIIKFNQTETGRRVMQCASTLTTEAITIANDFGKRFAMSIQTYQIKK